MFPRHFKYPKWQTFLSCTIHANRASDREQLRTGNPQGRTVHRNRTITDCTERIVRQEQECSVEQRYRRCSPAPNYHFAVIFIHIALRSFLITSKYQKHSSDVFVGETALLVSTGVCSINVLLTRVYAPEWPTGAARTSGISACFIWRVHSWWRYTDARYLSGTFIIIIIIIIIHLRYLYDLKISLLPILYLATNSTRRTLFSKQKLSQLMVTMMQVTGSISAVTCFLNETRLCKHTDFSVSKCTQKKSSRRARTYTHAHTHTHSRTHTHTHIHTRTYTHTYTHTHAHTHIYICINLLTLLFYCH